MNKIEFEQINVEFMWMTYKKACAFLNKHFLWFDFWLDYKKKQ